MQKIQVFSLFVQTVVNFVEPFKVDLLHWRCPITFRRASGEIRKKPIWRDALGIKHILGVAFFGKWLRQVDKTPSVTCRAVKQMNKCVWDYVGGRVVCLRFLCLWFFGFFGFRVCVVLFVCLWFWGRGCLVWFFLMLCRISTWGNKPQRGYLGTVEQCKKFI